MNLMLADQKKSTRGEEEMMRPTKSLVSEYYIFIKRVRTKENRKAPHGQALKGWMSRHVTDIQEPIADGRADGCSERTTMTKIQDELRRWVDVYPLSFHCYLGGYIVQKIQS